MPTYQGVRLEDGECRQTARPDPIEPDPEPAFAPAETQLAISVGDHRQLLSECEDLQVEDGPTSEEAGQSGEQGEEGWFSFLGRYRPGPGKVNRINQYKVSGRDRLEGKRPTLELPVTAHWAL